jgi:hypothetical protein
MDARNYIFLILTTHTMVVISFHTRLWTLTIIILAVIITISTMNYYSIPQLAAHKIKNSENKTQQPQDLMTCMNKSMQSLLNGDLNFSNPDPMSHCFDQLFKNHGTNGNNNNNGSNNNNLDRNSTFYNV